MKKILLILSIIFTTFILIGCNETEKDITITKSDIYDEISLILSSNDNYDSITNNIELTTIVFDEFVITWHATNDAITINNNIAVVTRSDLNKEVDLVASFTFEEKIHTKEFNLVVLELEIEEPIGPNIDEIKNEILITFMNNDTLDSITSHINLTNSSLSFNVYWESNDEAIVINNINTLGLVSRKEFNVNVILTAKFELNNITYTKEFNLTVLKLDQEIAKSYYQNFNDLISFRNDNYSEPKSAYLNDYDFDLNDINYDIVNYRSDIGMNSNSPLVMTLSGQGNDEGIAGRGFIRGNNIIDGINSFKFEARLPFSPESTYPQTNGKDTFTNATISLSIYKQGQLVFKEAFKFTSNTEANKGKIFEVTNLEISGTYTFELDISSGHRVSIGFIAWDAYKTITNEPELITSIGFDRLEVDQYFTGNYTFNDIDFNVSKFWSNYKNIHAQKEYPFITAVNQKDIARFKPEWDEAAYIYNDQFFDKVSKIEFMARNFGDYQFSHSAIIKIYYQVENNTDWIIVDQSFILDLEFKTFSVDINQENVRIKIEINYDQEYMDGAIGSTVNLDNIKYWS